MVATDQISCLGSWNEGLVLEDQIARLPFRAVFVKNSRCFAHNFIVQRVRLLVGRRGGLVLRRDRTAVG